MLRQGDQMFKASLGYIITEKKKKERENLQTLGTVTLSLLRLWGNRTDLNKHAGRLLLGSINI